MQQQLDESKFHYVQHLTCNDTEEEKGDLVIALNMNIDYKTLDPKLEENVPRPKVFLRVQSGSRVLKLQ